MTLLSRSCAAAVGTAGRPPGMLVHLLLFSVRAVVLAAQSISTIISSVLVCNKVATNVVDEQYFITVMVISIGFTISKIPYKIIPDAC